MNLVEGIKMVFPLGTEIDGPIDDVSFPFEIELHGEMRILGKFLNFRTEPPNTLVFDFSSESVYGDQFIRDYMEGRVILSNSREPISQDGNYFEGFLNVQIMGCLSIPEPPTTVCDECGKVFPAMDAYKSTKWENRLVCPECYERGEKAGRMKLREGISSESS